jgi:uncharacterized repeat protein (TIGR03803 family)
VATTEFANVTTADSLQWSEQMKITMMRHYLRSGILLSFCAIAATVTPAAAQASFRIVSYLNGYYSTPIALTEGSPGVFYLAGGGSNNSAFSITTKGSKTLLATFPAGTFIDGPLVSGANNRFYSVVQLSINPANIFSVGSEAGSKLTYQAVDLLPVPIQNLPDGNLLGVGIALSANPSYLTSTSLSGSTATIYTFPSGQHLPLTAIYASDGNYYGIAYLQDASGYVYRITPSGSFTIMHNFPVNTLFDSPDWVPLLQASDGNLYGALPTGGANGTGAIYKLTLGGQYTLLYTFPKGQGYHPGALIEGSDGNLYGATDGSLLFRVSTSGQYALQYTMASLAADGGCQCQLAQGSDGIIYGTASAGGVTGGGVVFALDAGLPKPAPRTQYFSPASGAVGTRVRIWGYNLLSASVEFNGVAATTVSSSGPNYVWATVPTGAITGPITVTTPGGTVMTTASFTVSGEAR